jgi:hypothetical protein
MTADRRKSMGGRHPTIEASLEIHALIVRQWLQEWDAVHFSAQERRSEPEHFFYVFSLPASRLRKLSTVYRRKAKGPRAQETAMQRAHDPRRSEEIRRFIFGGFPWSDLSEGQREQELDLPRFGRHISVTQRPLLPV